MSTSGRFPVPGEGTPDPRDWVPRLVTVGSQYCYCADCIRCGCALWEMHHPTLALPLVQAPTLYRLDTATRGQVSPDPVRPVRWRTLLGYCAASYALLYGALRVLAELVGMPWLVRVPLVMLAAAFVGALIGKLRPTRWALPGRRGWRL